MTAVETQVSEGMEQRRPGSEVRNQWVNEILVGHNRSEMAYLHVLGVEHSAEAHGEVGVVSICGDSFWVLLLSNHGHHRLLGPGIPGRKGNGGYRGNGRSKVAFGH